MRIGVFQFTSNRYSGGRVYVWQYCWAAAMLGHDVTLVTNRKPAWANDLPAVPGNRLHVKEDKGGFYDFDVLVTDAKCSQGQRAIEHKQKKNVPLLVVNFETSNWVKKYDPAYAAQDSTNREIAQQADHYISISELAKQHFSEWGGVVPAIITVIPPAINEYAVREASQQAFPSLRRFAVWSGHTIGYKGWDAVVEALHAIPFAFDLVVFGEKGHVPRPSLLHPIHNFASKSEIEKLRVFRSAHMCLAPSLFEGYGMVPGEALAMGTQCVAYDLPVLREAYGQPWGLHYCTWNDRNEFIEMTRQVACAPKPVLPDQNILQGRSLQDMIKRVAKLPYHGV